jgi:hypothetical protein
MEQLATTEPPTQPWRIDWPPRDPRYYQIAVLSGLLVYGIGWLDFDVGWPQVLTLLCTVLISQFVCAKIAGLPGYDPRSALISGLSLCLLLRTNNPRLLIAAGVVTIASKFIFTWRGKHIFNPTNFVIVIMLALTGAGLSVAGAVGQQTALRLSDGLFWRLVIHRAMRSDVSYAFILTFAAILFARTLGSATHGRFRSSNCRAARCCYSPFL